MCKIEIFFSFRTCWDTRYIPICYFNFFYIVFESKNRKISLLRQRSLIFWSKAIFLLSQIKIQGFIYLIFIIFVLRSLDYTRCPNIFRNEFSGNVKNSRNAKKLVKVCFWALLQCVQNPLQFDKKNHKIRGKKREILFTF